MDFEYFRSDAQLNFDLGFKNEVDVRKSVERVKDADVVVFVGGVSPNLEGEEMVLSFPDSEEATVLILSCLLSSGN